jgi:hypothetical protein
MRDLMYDYERTDQINRLRADLVTAALELTAERYKMMSMTITVDFSKLDAAAEALTDKMREPAHCQACGQEVPAPDA